MQDRVPLYPGRVKLIPVTGQENTYDMVRADEPTQEGTPLNKDSLLKDATAALYGLGAAAVPDNVLALIKPMIDSNYSELSSLANSKAKIDIGSYVGTGEYYKTLTFPQLPKFVFINEVGGYAAAMFISIVDNVAGVRVITNGNPQVRQGVISGNSIQWTFKSGEYIYAMNANNTTYYWVSIT